VNRRDAYIIEGVVSEERTKEHAAERYVKSHRLTRIHYHPADAKDCNDRCTWWPPVQDRTSQ
jgi:hypothetical protein